MVNRPALRATAVFIFFVALAAAEVVGPTVSPLDVSPDHRSWSSLVANVPLFRFIGPVDAPTLAVAMPVSTPRSCSVPLLTPLEGEALDFEQGASLLTIRGLTAATMRALSQFERLVKKAGGSVTLTSAYRPAAYQSHLQSVWDQWMLYLRHNNEPGCQELKAEVQNEFQRHGLIARQRPVDTSDHTYGIAFDASVALPARRAKRRAVRIDTLARRAGIMRPAVRRDPVHFRLIGSRPVLIASAD